VRPNRRQVLFLVRFSLLLAVLAVSLLVSPVDRAVITPFTRFLAASSAVILRVLGENAAAAGTTISDSGFAVDIKNGCNGVEATLFLCAAIIAFDASRRERAIAVFLGIFAIQAANLVRIVSLYLLGRHKPDVFGLFHLAIWQTLMFALAVSFFVAWTARAGKRDVVAGR
jgi:exosortase H (IPTLxxWG-CTERM-specific)